MSDYLDHLIGCGVQGELLSPRPRGLFEPLFSKDSQTAPNYPEREAFVEEDVKDEAQTISPSTAPIPSGLKGASREQGKGVRDHLEAFHYQMGDLEERPYEFRKQSECFRDPPSRSLPHQSREIASKRRGGQLGSSPAMPEVPAFVFPQEEASTERLVPQPDKRAIGIKPILRKTPQSPGPAGLTPHRIVGRDMAAARTPHNLSEQRSNAALNVAISPNPKEARRSLEAPQAVLQFKERRQSDLSTAEANLDKTYPLSDFKPRNGVAHRPLIHPMNEPTIQVTIGRIEVRAVMEQTPRPRKVTESRPRLSLEAYLKQSPGGRQQ